MIFGWFKSKEEKKEKEKEEEVKVAAYTKSRHDKLDYNVVLSQVVFTPEGKSEYERRVGYEVDVIDTSNRNKGVVFLKQDSYRDFEFLGDLKLKKTLAEAGIEALVNANLSFYGEYGDNFYYYGLPVAKKKGGPYR